MTLMEFSIWFFVVVVFVTLVDKWLKRRIMKNADIPGPIGLPVLGRLFQVFFYSNSQLLQMAREWFHKCGPIIILWGLYIPFIHIGSDEYAEAILSSSIHIDKGCLYTFIQPWLGTGLLTSTGEKWHRRRKMLTASFHFSILNTFTDIFVNNSEILLKKLESNLNSEPFDIFPFLSACTLDIICEMIVHRVMNPVIYPDFIHRLSKNYRLQQKSLKVLHEMSLRVIQERIAERKRYAQCNNVDEINNEWSYGGRTKKAFLDLLLDASETDNNSLSVQDIREEVDTFMFEGHDTTSSALGWVIFAVGNHPDVQVSKYLGMFIDFKKIFDSFYHDKIWDALASQGVQKEIINILEEKIYEELDDIFGNSDRPPNSNDLARMKYLECVLKETMRLFPPVPILSRRLVVDTKMGDYNIPANTTVLIHIHQIHRSPKYFSNPEEFNPSNFSSHRESHMNPYGYIPFSAGPRNCIGQKFAMIEEKILLSSFFRKFGVKSIEKMETISSAPDTVLRPTKGIMVKLKKRD